MGLIVQDLFFDFFFNIISNNGLAFTNISAKFDAEQVKEEVKDDVKEEVKEEVLDN